MDTICAYHDFDIQWGNHDILWMGAYAGNDASIANAVRIALRYGNVETLEEGYAINLLPLATFAMETYKDVDAAIYKPRIKDPERMYSEYEKAIMAGMHKAIAIIQWKLEGQIIERHPDYRMNDRLLLGRIDYAHGTINIDGTEYQLKDTDFPTIDPENPYRLTEAESQIVGLLHNSFVNSERLGRHIECLLSHGSLYLSCNNNLMFHASIPMNADASFKDVTVDGETFSGKRLLDRLDTLVQLACRGGDEPERNYAIDYMWYLWCGPDSPLFDKSKMTTLERYLIAATILSGRVFLFPPLYGEGYSSIVALLSGNTEAILDGSVFYSARGSALFIMAFLLVLTVTKAFATSATNGAGGVGGTFAPSLFVGCMAGFFFAYTLNDIFGLTLSVKNFALMGMAGVMAGVMHAPLMAIFLTAELTGGYTLFLPLLIVSALSYFTIKAFEPYSIYAMRLAQRGELLTHHKDKAVLTLLKIDNVIETDFLPVHPDMDLRQMVNVISESKRNLFPVTDKDDRLIGIVLLDDIRNIMFRPDLYRRMHVSKFMSSPPAIIDIHSSMEEVMKVFDSTGAWNLPVVDGDKYVGFVSKSKIFNSYRRVLRHYSED